MSATSAAMLLLAFALPILVAIIGLIVAQNYLNRLERRDEDEDQR